MLCESAKAVIDCIFSSPTEKAAMSRNRVADNGVISLEMRPKSEDGVGEQVRQRKRDVPQV